MATDCPVGSIVTVQLSSYTDNGAASDVAAALSYLQNINAYSSVGSPVITTPGLLSEIADTVFSDPYQATLYLTPQIATDSDTIAYNVSQAFAEETGNTPASVAVTSVQVQGGAAVATGAPGNTPASLGGTASNSVATLSTSVSGFFSGLETGGVALLIGLAAIVILVLVFAAYHPEVVKSAAGAAFL